MARVYDLIVVGAGPAGLMAAKVAGENGLSVALLERKQEIVAVRRSCATMFAIEDSYYFGERMYFNERQQRLVFPVTGFSLPYAGPHRNFYAWHVYTPEGDHYLKIGDYAANRARGAAGRLSVTYSKQELLRSLLADAVAAGVEVYRGRNVIRAATIDRQVHVRTAEGESFCGTFAVAADGINSRLVASLGLNRQRTFYGTLHGVSCFMSDLNLPHPEAIAFPQLFHEPTGCPIMIWIQPSPYADGQFWVYAGGPTCPGLDYRVALDRCMRDSPFAQWFAGASIAGVQAHVANMWSPVASPVVDNVRIAGDAGWTTDAECTGSLMCGFKAAHAVSEALREKRCDADGVQRYARWWQQCFPDTMDYREFLAILSAGLLGREATGYLWRLITDVLPCSLNPYTLFQHINAAINSKMAVIARERPDVLARMQQLGAVPLEQQLRGIMRDGFPNR